jgi:hypothetical protein
VKVPPAAASPASPAPTSPQQPARTPNNRGHSPALDHREQQSSVGERAVSIGGKEYSETEISEAMAERIEPQLA